MWSRGTWSCFEVMIAQHGALALDAFPSVH
jgi:hypothetical protein